MSDSAPRKRESDDIPNFDDPVDLVNAVISTLQIPDEKTNVAHNYANDKNLATEIQAYAKIAGQDWTFYVKSLAISIGRNTENPLPGQVPNQSLIDIDLGPAKVVSRQHATITYNIDLSCWELKVLGRNGARIDGQKMPVGPQHATPLHSGAILDIGGTQMIFILPDSPPNILQKMLHTCLSRYKRNNNNMNKSRKISDYSNSNTIKSFQMFNKSQLTQSPSSASALSLQNNLDQDLSKEEAKDIKPPYSYATMITQAILSNPDGVMSLSDIYNWISDHYAYYKYSKTGWQNSIRHNLSLNKAFDKVPRRPNEPGKGMKWQISDSYKQDFLNKIQNGSLSKTRRGSSVSRQLQLHLATHQQLPESQNYYNKDNKFQVNRDHLQQQQQQIPPPINFNQQRSDSFSFTHSRNNSIPKLGQPIQYSNNPMQSNPLAYMPNQQNGNAYVNMSNGNNSVRSYLGYQAGPPPPHLMYGGSLMHQNQSQQLTQDQKPKSELSSPIRQMSELNSTTPKLPKVSGGNLFNLPPPSQNQNQSQLGSTAPKIHSRLNSYTNPIDNSNTNTSTSTNNNNSESNMNSNNTTSTSAVGQSNNNSDFGMGFTSPKKITPLEAFTPERGSKSSSGNGKLGIPNGINTNQSSPAFWNFVQFSTPNAQTPMRKNSEELNSQGSPTLGRKLHGNGFKDDSDGKENGSKTQREKSDKDSIIKNESKDEKITA